MAFPTKDDDIPYIVVQRVLARARSLNMDAIRYIAACDAGSLNVHDVANGFMTNHLALVKTELLVLSSVPGLYDEFARQKPDQFATPAAAQIAFAGFQTAINNIITFLETNLPMDAQRRILSLTVSNDGSGRLTQVTISAPAALAAFKAQLVTFRNTFTAQ